LASTNQTGSLGLPQWEGTDTVEHGDFNGALAKIDEAIRQINEAIEGRVRKKLLDVTIDKEQNSITLNLPEEEMDSYAELELIFDFSNNKFMRINGISAGYDQSSSSGGSSQDHIFLANGVNRMSISRTGIIYRPAEGNYHYKAANTSLLPPKTLEIYAEDTDRRLKPGDHITIWGVKR